MNTNSLKGVNVAVESTSGHYVQEATNVVNLDEVSGTFLVQGESKLVTQNHTTLVQEKDCLITTQMVYNPFAKMFEKSQD